MKPSWHSLLVILVSLLASLPAAGEVWYVPGAAESTGLAGARFSSTLVVANLSSAGVTASIGFIPYDGSPTPEPVERPLAAGQTLQIPAVLETLFGLTADAGTLTVSAPATLAISLVTANVADPAGTYGVSVAPLMEDSLIGAGQTGHAVWATENADYRTNLALVFADPGTSVEVTALDNEGKSRGTVPVTSERRSSWQARLPDLFPGLDLSAGRVEVKVIRGRVTGYTATVDNNTNDGIAASLVRAPAGTSDLLLNGAANSPGRNGTFFVTDARVWNASSTPAVVTFQSVGVPDARTFSQTIPALGLAEIRNVFGPEGFGYPEGTVGAFRLRATTPLVAAALTRTPAPEGKKGFFGSFLTTVQYPDGLLVPGTQGSVAGINHISGATGFRTNVAFLAGASGAEGTMILKNANGVEVGRTPVSLSPDQWQQRSVSEWFPAVTSTESSRIDLALTSGSADMYAARVDNGTGDGVVLHPRALASSEPQPDKLPAGPLQIVTLGDSLTAGDGDEAEKGGYPGRLRPMVEARRPGSRVTNFGLSGWTSNDMNNGQLPDALQEIARGKAEGRVPVAMVWIGSNDLWALYEYGTGSDQGDAEDLTNYTANIEFTLRELSNAGAFTFVALLDDQSKRPVALAGEAFPGTTPEELARMSRQVVRYNTAIREKAAAYKATTVDFFNTTIFVNPATLADDGNHPNAAGYEIITQLWFGALSPRL